MNLYGDRGNLMVLEKRCKDRGIDVEIKYCDIDDKIDLSQMDLIFFGGGADKEQGYLIDDLLKRKANIQQALDKGTIFLLICGGYQLFGKYYVDASGKQIDGLHIFDYYTISGTPQERCVGNIAIHCNFDDEEMILVGFENHGGQTYHVATPLGKVMYGNGNNATEKQEGFYNGQVLGTYLHGPLLPKNPELADLLIKKSLQRNYGEVTLTPLDDTLEFDAKRVMLDRLQK